jgi:hypothetical protein
MMSSAGKEFVPNVRFPKIARFTCQPCQSI